MASLWTRTMNSRSREEVCGCAQGLPTCGPCRRKLRSKGSLEVTPGEDRKALLRDAQLVNAYLWVKAENPNAQAARAAWEAWKRLYAGLQLSE